MVLIKHYEFYGLCKKITNLRKLLNLQGKIVPFRNCFEYFTCCIRDVEFKVVLNLITNRHDLMKLSVNLLKPD